MSKSNKREQRTSAKYQKPNPLRWETTTVDSAAYGQDTALQQGQIMIDASSSSLYTQSRLYSQEKLHNSQIEQINQNFIVADHQIILLELLEPMCLFFELMFCSFLLPRQKIRTTKQVPVCHGSLNDDDENVCNFTYAALEG